MAMHLEKKLPLNNMGRMPLDQDFFISPKYRGAVHVQMKLLLNNVEECMPPNVSMA